MESGNPMIMVKAMDTEVSMDKDSAYELQKIDCNCNNCGFMQRDFELFKKWEEWHKEQEMKGFNRERLKLLASPSAEEQQKGRTMVFQFEKRYLLNYGWCTQFDKTVSFIPNVCQLHTQQCFVHRKDLNYE